MLIRKIDSQPTEETSAPPTIGPSAIETPKTAPHTPTACARSRGSVKVLVMIDIATGLSIDAPTRLQDAGGDEQLDARREAAQQRSQREHAQAGDQRALAAEPVGHRAGEQQQARHHDRVGARPSTAARRCPRRGRSPIAGRATLTAVMSSPTRNRLIEQMSRIAVRPTVLPLHNDHQIITISACLAEGVGQQRGEPLELGHAAVAGDRHGADLPVLGDLHPQHLRVAGVLVAPGEVAERDRLDRVPDSGELLCRQRLRLLPAAVPERLVAAVGVDAVARLAASRSSTAIDCTSTPSGTSGGVSGGGASHHRGAVGRGRGEVAGAAAGGRADVPGALGAGHLAQDLEEGGVVVAAGRPRRWT